MLTQFPEGFSVAQLCITLAADVNKQLCDRKIQYLLPLSPYFYFFERHFFFFTRMQTQKSAGVEGHPCLEEGLMALLVFEVMAPSFPSQEIWMGTILHGARNFNVVAEVTLP